MRLSLVIPVAIAAISGLARASCDTPPTQRTDAQLARDGVLLGVGSDYICLLASVSRSAVSDGDRSPLSRSACEDTVVMIHARTLSRSDLEAIATFRGSRMLRTMMDTTQSGNTLSACSVAEQAALTHAMQNVLDGMQSARDSLRSSNGTLDDIGMLSLVATTFGVSLENRWSDNPGLLTAAYARWCETADAPDFEQLAELFEGHRGRRIVTATVRSMNMFGGVPR